jgi:hypothetical protein
VGYQLPYKAKCFAVDPSEFEPKPADSESTMLPITPRAIKRELVRAEGFEPPMPEGNCFTDSRDNPIVASHA